MSDVYGYAAASVGKIYQGFNYRLVIEVFDNNSVVQIRIYNIYIYFNLYCRLHLCGTVTPSCMFCWIIVF